MRHLRRHTDALAQRGVRVDGLADVHSVPEPDGVGAGSSERSPVIDHRPAATRPVRATRLAMIGQAGEQRVFWGGECRQGPQARRITALCPKP